MLHISDGERIGYLVLSVTIRKESREMISTLRDCGVQSVLLTGDNENSANSIAKQLGISEVYAGCLPEDKFVVDSLQILPHIRAFQPFIYIHFDTLYFLLWCNLFQKFSDLQVALGHDTGGGLSQGELFAAAVGAYISPNVAVLFYPFGLLFELRL